MFTHLNSGWCCLLPIDLILYDNQWFRLAKIVLWCMIYLMKVLSIMCQSKIFISVRLHHPYFLSNHCYCTTIYLTEYWTEYSHIKICLPCPNEIVCASIFVCDLIFDICWCLYALSSMYHVVCIMYDAFPISHDNRLIN